MTQSTKNSAEDRSGPGPTPAVAAAATLDHGRAERCGHAEVVYAAGKTADDVVGITRELLAAGQPAVLLTRCPPEHVTALRQGFSDVGVEAGERSGTVIVGTPEVRSTTPIPIVTAGTSDLAVAEEAAMTCRALGFTPHAINDVGVAGVHRVLERADELRAGSCVVVVAGMEGALPSVVGGLVDVPVIAVPTSVGYGASFGGVSALLGMLNSCASGVTVVNIDNGFGGAYAACQIERVAMRAAGKGRATDERR